MDYHDAVDMFISLICTNDQFYDNGLKLRLDISNKFNSFVKSKLNKFYEFNSNFIYNINLF
jgi:hypothetical protein